ncbi:preprotein translocase subunit SecE [Luteococcus sanguinis]|uniref:Protein translocase subunit SecE n=1 Tax=Luteococcus sanguinis TaxID=174038 RepID=A0ABW1X0I0_9ACTN
MADDQRPEPFGDDEAQLSDTTDPAGEQLAADLPAQADSYELVDTEAEEIEFADVELDQTPFDADPADVVIDDAAQLAAAEQAARKARSSRPVKRQTPLADESVGATDSVAEIADEQPAADPAEQAAIAAQVARRRPVKRVAPEPEVASTRRAVRRKPVDKSETGTLTPTRQVASAAAVADHGRTTPIGFVNQAIGELRKVIWPTGEQLGNYFAVVLVFVLFMIAFVGLLDFGFGWLLLKLFGK